MTKTYSVTCTLDKSGNIRHNKGTLLTCLDNTENRGKGCEVVIGNLRLCGTYNGNQRGFAHVGESYKSHIGKQFQFKSNLELLTGEAGF